MEVVKTRKDWEHTLNIVNQSASTLKAKTSTVSNEPLVRELPGLRHETKDVLKQLQQNIALLEDLGGRLGFVMSEVRSVIRR